MYRNKSKIKTIFLFFVCTLSLQGTAQISLNHVYVVVDSNQFDAIENSNFISERFCTTRKGSAKDQKGKTWSGLYLFGQRTYLELFDGAQNKDPIGTVGIALSVERIGALDSIHEILKNESVDVKYEFRYRQTPSGLIPWFKSLTLLHDSLAVTPIKIWIMEYDSSYMARVPQVRDKSNISRQAYNKRLYDSTRYLQELNELQCYLSKDNLKKIQNILIRIGIKMQNGSFLFGDPEFYLTTHSSPEKLLLKFKTKANTDWPLNLFSIKSQQPYFNFKNQKPLPQNH